MESLKQKIVEIITNRDKTPVEQADEILLLVGVMHVSLLPLKMMGVKRNCFGRQLQKQMEMQ